PDNVLRALPPRPAGTRRPGPVKRYPARAFFNTTDFYLADPLGTVSPGGDRLLLTANTTGVFNCYELDAVTGKLTPLTTSAGNAAFAVSYFPDAKRFIFTADNGGDELTHVFVGGDGDPIDLTPGDGLKAGFGAWIEDGKAFTVTTNERDPRYFDLYRVDAETLERRMLFRNDAGFVTLKTSRDGTMLALLRARTSADNDIYLARLDTGAEPELITAHEGNVSHSIFDFTPGGQALIFGTNANGEFTEAWSHDIASGEQTTYLRADWDILYVEFSPSGGYRVHGVNDDGTTRVTVFDLDRNRPVSMSGNLPDGDVTDVRFFPGERRVAFLLTASNAPRNVYVAGLERDRFTRLTAALGSEIDPAHLAKSEVVRYASYDGLAIPAILTKPLQASADNPAPAIVFVHGGPGGQSRSSYSATVQHLANHGYAVLAPNNRGSYGYGKTFFHMDDRRHGDADLRDIVAAKDYLAAQDWVDDGSIAVMGQSYGGFMTMAALAFYPATFDAGINVFGVTNWVRTLESIPPWWEAYRQALYDEMGDPATDRARHRAISPLFHADRITKPVLIVQGANDPRVLQVESDEMVAAIEANDVPVEYLLFEDEGHGFLRRENRISASNKYVEFLDRYLRDAP
ncbi:MAG: S9 family peptidase, partial [Pseudomonadota bacterium]